MKSFGCYYCCSRWAKGVGTKSDDEAAIDDVND